MERVIISPAERTQELEFLRIGPEGSTLPVIVFLHEGLGSIALWRDFPVRLCARLGVRGLVYSRFGYGGSTPRPHEERFPVSFMHREATEVLPELLDALGIDRPWLFGHSDGGSIALLAAAHAPERFPGVIVMAPHLFVEEYTIDSIRKARTAYQEGGLRERLARYHRDVDSAFYGWNDVWLDPAFRAWNIETEIGKIVSPLLAIQGEDDEYGTLDQIHALRRHVPQTRLAVLPRCGHSPHRDQPEAVIRETEKFMRECGLSEI